MDWKIEFTKKAQKQFNSLDNLVKLRIKKYILEKLTINPKLHLIPLLGDKSGFYKFRVGDYRLLCAKEDDKYIITVIKVKHGKEVYNLPVECEQSENLNLKKNSIDLFLAMGSLEHVVDINVIFRKITNAAKKNSIIVLEARGDPLGHTKKFFNFNHHRYFLKNTIQLILIKYGFRPILTTKYPITGATRQGTIFCIAKYEGKKIKKNKIAHRSRKTY